MPLLAVCQCFFFFAWNITLPYSSRRNGNENVGMLISYRYIDNSMTVYLNSIYHDTNFVHSINLFLKELIPKILKKKLTSLYTSFIKCEHKLFFQNGTSELKHKQIFEFLHLVFFLNGIGTE